MIKRISAAQHHPTNRSVEDFRAYWSNAHGPMGANVKTWRRYVQHISLPEAYGADPEPNFDGVSMFWSDELPGDHPKVNDADVLEMSRAIRDDDRQLFDRAPGWPTHAKRASVISGEEKIVVEGVTTPEMIKVVFIVAKLPGLSFTEFFAHWQNEHAGLTEKVPGLRRYVQNPALLDAYGQGTMTHDGWSELWFDDLDRLHRATQSAEWATARSDAETLFSSNTGIVVCRERVQREFDWAYYDWGAGDLDEQAIRKRLSDDGYEELATDPDAPRRIKSAAERQSLAIWSNQHLVTIDDSKIDARPTR